MKSNRIDVFKALVKQVETEADKGRVSNQTKKRFLHEVSQIVGAEEVEAAFTEAYGDYESSDDETVERHEYLESRQAPPKIVQKFTVAFKVKIARLFEFGITFKNEPLIVPMPDEEQLPASSSVPKLETAV